MTRSTERRRRPRRAAVVASALMFVLVASAGAQVRFDELETRDGLLYLASSDSPYTGVVHTPGDMKGNVENGKRVGEWVHWFPNGQRGMVANYRDGVITERSNYYENGQLSSKTVYDAEGRITGLMQHWDRNGTLREAHEWKAGDEHGPAKLFDHEGRLVRTANYVEGVRHGAEIWWYPDGTKLWETHYENGRRAGTWTQYTLDGRMLATSTWDDGSLVSFDRMRHD